MSSAKVALPGTTFGAPGDASTAPTVATRAGSVAPAARRSTARIISAAAARASLRRLMGTVPACPASPTTSIRNRLAPAIAVTIPDRQLQLLEHRPLLDVQLDIAQHRLAPAGEGGDGGGIAAEAAQGRLEMHALLVGDVERLRLEGAGDRARAR